MIALIISILFSGLFLSNPAASPPCDPPQIVYSTCGGGNVIINFQTTSPPSLLGFNFYRNGEFLEYLPHTGDSVYTHYFTNQPPGIHTYCITAVCDLAYNEYPGETIESEPDCEIVSCIYGFDLPFEENWNLGSFSTSDWVISSDNWIISVDTGNSAPSAVFEPEIPLTDYVESLESYYLNAFGMTEGYIFLGYDLYLSSADSSGTEHFIVQIWDHQSEEYSTVQDYSNQTGSFGWTRDTININAFSMNKVFRIRFVAQGENSSHIHYWGIDNISVYRECYPPPYSLGSYLLNDTCIVLEYNENDQRELVYIITYVQKDGEFIAMYSLSDPIPNPYCVNESGEYCFFMSAYWASESDICESGFTEPTCQQVNINSLDEMTNSPISVFYNPVYEIVSVESRESIDQLDIFDFSGRFVCSVSPGTAYFNKDLSHLKPGLYLIRIKISKQTVTRKLIIN